jgi:heme/copper-type cytochrome/quinol oxidase subunit 4
METKINFLLATRLSNSGRGRKSKDKKYIIGFCVFILFCMLAIQAYADEYGTTYGVGGYDTGINSSTGTSANSTGVGTTGGNPSPGTWSNSTNTQTGGVSSVSGYSGSGSGVILPTWSGLPQGTVEGVVFSFLMWLLSIFGFLAIISFIVSGVQYFLAFGEEKNMERAKRNMEYSIIGVVVGLMGVIIIFAVDYLLRGMSIF